MSDENVKVTIYLTPRAYACLEEASMETQDSKTDTINRALALYNELLWSARTGIAFSFDLNEAGDKIQVLTCLEIAPRTQVC